jgi:4a-hydroxytetrahydrobiopterin dehydratase
MTVKTHTDDEVVARLSAELPTWRLEAGSLRRTYQTGGWKGTIMLVSTVGHLAEAAWHHPDLAVSYARIVVKLRTHDARGITDKDFALAKKIEEVVMWQPGKEGNGLDGTPPEAGYVVYE